MSPSTRSDAASSPRTRLSAGWRLLEAFFSKVYHVRPLLDEGECLFAYNLSRHHGPDVPLQCGAVVRSGDHLMEIHFLREALLPLIADGDPHRMGISLLRLGDRDIPQLARVLAERPELAGVKAVHALTLFHRGITRYGFEVLPVRERLLEWWFTTWQRTLMARDHPGHSRHVRAHRQRLVVRHVWVSRESLIRNFNSPGA